MATVTVKPGQLGPLLQSRARASAPAIKAGLRVAAERAVSHLKRLSPVDQGQAKNAWSAHPTPSGAVAENDAPHAGIIEVGARPHPVNEAGVAAIRAWVERHLQVMGRSGPRLLTRGERESDLAYLVDEMTWGIVKKIEKQGQKGLFIVRDNLELLKRWAADEVVRAVHRSMSTPDGAA